MELVSQEEVQQWARTTQEGFVRDAQSYPQRCNEEVQENTQWYNDRIQQGRQELVQFQEHAELHSKASEERHKEYRQAEHLVAIYKNQTFETEQSAQNSLSTARRDTTELAQLVMLQKSELQTANAAVHSMENRAEQVVQYQQASANQ